jgi:hypothetical protein
MLQNMPHDSRDRRVCSLPPQDRPQRTRDFQALFTGSFVDRVRTPTGVVWTLLYSPATEQESRRLADLERRCCDGVTFDLRVGGEFVVWTIEAPIEAAPVLDVFFELPELMKSEEGASAAWSRLDAHACWRQE